MRDAIEDGGSGTVEAIYVAAAEGTPMRAVDGVAAVPGGLRGDRYLEGTGHWSRFGRVCEVTFIAAEDLEAIGRETGVRVLHGEHRRNVVTRGIEPATLRGARFTIGDATFEVVGPRSVCRYVERITEPGMTDALRGRGGLCARVLRGGVFAVGDAIRPIGAGGAPASGRTSRIPRGPGPAQARDAVGIGAYSVNVPDFVGALRYYDARTLEPLDERPAGVPDAGLTVPRGHLPPPGECRIWHPNRPAGQQPPPLACEEALRTVPAGAWVLDRETPRTVVVTAYHPDVRGLVLDTRTFDLDD